MLEDDEEDLRRKAEIFNKENAPEVVPEAEVPENSPDLRFS